MSTSPLVLSFEIALVATAGSALIGVGLAGVLAGRRFPGRAVLDALLATPLVLPPTVLGYALLTVLGRRSALGIAWENLTGASLVFTRTGAVVAASVTAIPLIWQTSRAALESVPSGYLEAARVLGAGPFRVLTQVQIPLARRGIMAGVVLAFARALGDFGVTLMVAGNIPDQTRTGALAIYDALLNGDEASAFSLAVTMTGLAVALMAVTTFLSERADAR